MKLTDILSAIDHEITKFSVESLSKPKKPVEYVRAHGIVAGLHRAREIVDDLLTKDAARRDSL